MLERGAREMLDSVVVTVPAAALEPFEAALSSACRAVSFFHDEANDLWNLEGVKERGAFEPELAAGIAVAELLTGHSAEVTRGQVPAGGWLARNQASFPEQKIGRRFAVRGTHIAAARLPGRITITLDAGLAFGTGEHNSTRGCLCALERIAYRKPRRIIDLGAGSGVLALAATKLLRRPVLTTDIDPRATRVAAANARLNGAGRYIKAIPAEGWASKTIARRAPYDLIFANILARPLCAMAHELARHLAPGGTAILAGLLNGQANWVISAHRRAGLVLERRLTDGAWTTLVLRRRR